MAWSERAVVSAIDDSLAIILKEKDPVYGNILDLPNKQLTATMCAANGSRTPTALIRLFFRFSGQPHYKYLGDWCQTPVS